MSEEVDEFADALSEDNAVASPDDESTDELTPRRTRKRRSDAGVKRTGTGAPRGRRSSQTRIAGNLLQFWGISAAALAPRAPTAAAVLIQRGEITCNALVEIAQKHPAMLKILESMGSIGPVAVVIQTGVEASLAAAMDFGKLPPEHPMAQGLGLTETYIRMHPDYGRLVDTQDAPPQERRVTQPPPGFIPASDPRHPMYSWAARNPFGVSA